MCFLHTLQYTVLDQAALVHPNAQWWIKADGTDVAEGLGESVRGEWSGDVDLPDGKLQKQFEKYVKQLKFISVIGLEARQSRLNILEDLTLVKGELLQDLTFVSSGTATCYCCIFTVGTQSKFGGGFRCSTSASVKFCLGFDFFGTANFVLPALLSLS